MLLLNDHAETLHDLGAKDRLGTGPLKAKPTFAKLWRVEYKRHMVQATRFGHECSLHDGGMQPADIARFDESLENRAADLSIGSYSGDFGIGDVKAERGHGLKARLLIRSRNHKLRSRIEFPPDHKTKRGAGMVPAPRSGDAC
jgi:hypothetical protein